MEVTKREFEKLNDEKYLKQNPYAWTEQQRMEMNRAKATYAEIDAREKRIVVKNAFPIKETLKHMMFRFDPAEGGWYHPLGTPAENRQIVTTLKSLGVETRMTMDTVQRTQYRGDMMGQVYDAHGPEKGQALVDEAARKALIRFGLIQEVQ
jgi:hypothetical protein